MPLSRILTVHNSYQQDGGEDVVFTAEAALLRQHGHEVVEYREDNRRIEEMSRLTVAARTIWSRSARERLLQVVRDVHPDVVHFHNTFLLVSPAAYYACREAGVPVVQTLHNYRLLCPAACFYRDGQVCEACLGRTPPWPGVVHACYRASRSQTAVVAAMLTVHRALKTWREQVDLYIALTAFARRKFIEGGLPREKLVIKPNFVYPDPGVKEGSGGYALFVGRLSPDKGLRILLRAWRRIQGIPLKIVGDGLLMDEVRAFVQEQQLGNIEVLGRRPRQEVLALMQGASFLVFPSEWYECFPVTIAEAFACGVPVVASSLGAMAEIVHDGRTGLHFKPGDPEDLAAKVEWAWGHSEGMAVMRREARAEYEGKYAAGRNYQRLIEIYQMAIDRHRLV
jgi:glycosyltransferase involved in cell wall biosynthesis